MNKLTKLHIEKITQPDGLTEKLLTPNIDVITQAFQGLRDSIDFVVNQIAFEQYGQTLKYLSFTPPEDKYFKQDLISYILDEFQWHKPLSSIPNTLSQYPEGRCFNITTITYNFVMNNLDLPEFNLISTYLKEGGVFKIIWGGVNLEFQTALQIGGYYVDVASDTVDWTEEKLTIAPLAKSDFYELHHYKQYARIKEPYHNCKIYRNDCLLEIALFFPFFIVCNETSKLHINTSHHMALSNCEQNFVPFTELNNFPTLPINFQKQLINKLSLNSTNLLSYQIFTQEDTRNQIKTLLSFTEKQKLNSLKTAHKLAHFVNFTLHSGKPKKIE